MSIRARLTIAIAVILLGTVAVLGSVAVRTTRNTLVAQVDEQVITQAERSKDRHDKEPPPEATLVASLDSGGYDPTYGDYGSQGPSNDGGGGQGGNGEDWERNDFAWMVYGPNGELLDIEPYGYADHRASPPDCPDIPSPELDEMLGEVVTLPAVDGSLEYRTLITQLDNGDFQAVGMPLTSVEAAVDDLLRVVLVAGTVALLAAIGVCWWVIRQGLRPVDDMVATAEVIAGGDMGARIENPDPATELGRLGQALNEMLGKIQAANDARAAGEQRLRRFVADAAHELRTPLTSLRGYAELYRQGALKEEPAVANAMGRIESEGARMARLVDDLLLLARLDQARGVEAAPVDLGTLVHDAVEDFRVVAPDRTVAVDIAEGVVVAGDRLRLRQIVDNLLSNVRTHTPAGTEVRVYVSNGGNQAVLTVADHGPGIAHADQERIFERFWRADPARTRSRGGTGLGLAIVASLVHAHDGSVSLESEPGRGAAFTVRLPLATAS